MFVVQFQVLFLLTISSDSLTVSQSNYSRNNGSVSNGLLTACLTQWVYTKHQHSRLAGLIIYDKYAFLCHDCRTLWLKSCSF